MPNQLKSSTMLLSSLKSASSDFFLMAKVRLKTGGTASAFAFQVSPSPVIPGYF